ncbi:MAG: class I SAM-dependent RNA methyltransferase [Oscillospiraceae bacterium]|nr:class I SAM-dependent RNA methyltransferase [Oscillospiraceae bacterium]
MIYRFCVPTLFGVEGLCSDELSRMGCAEVRAENGRVFFSGGASELARANLATATGERVLLVLGSFPARTFDELFEGAAAIAWEEFIPRDGAFPVAAGSSLESELHSIPDCQRIIKKAAAVRLTRKYGTGTHPETGVEHKIRFTIRKNAAEIFLDTSGAALHKRGYRTESVAAPLRETLAAAIVRVARYRGREALRDPFCGSGTIVIEAALLAKNRAPGLNRRFAAEKWSFIGNQIWKNEREALRAKEYSRQYDIWGGDIDPKCAALSEANARRAGVDDIVRFETFDARRFDGRSADGGIIVTNPPYGERIMERRDAETLYGEFGAAVREKSAWRKYILSSHTEFERTFGKSADKKRKLYNGMIKCDLFMYGV